MISEKVKVHKDKIYVDVTSLNFWWNIYELDKKTGWEDIVIYDKKDDEFEKIACTSICTKNFLRDYLDDLKDDLDEKEFVESIKKFLDNEKMYYHYYYNDFDIDDFEELPYDNLKTKNNIKPWFIEIWHPSKLIDIDVIKQCVIFFCDKFLNMKVDEVLLKETMPLEEAVYMHDKHLEIKDEENKITKNKNEEKEIPLMDDIVVELSKKWNKSKGDVSQMLKKILD